MLNLLQQSQHGTPIFIIPKKEGTVTFITDYCRINQKLVIKTHTVLRIGEAMQQLECFQYVN